MVEVSLLLSCLGGETAEWFQRVLPDLPTDAYAAPIARSLLRRSSTYGLTVSPTAGMAMTESRVGISFVPSSCTRATSFALTSLGSWFIATRMLSRVVDSSRSFGTAASAEAVSLMPVMVSVAERKKAVTCPVRLVTWSATGEGEITGAVCCSVLLLPHHQSNPTTMSIASTGNAQRRADEPAAAVSRAVLLASDIAACPA